MTRISNQTIVKFFEENINENLRKKLIGIFPANYINKFICFHDIFFESGAY